MDLLIQPLFLNAYDFRYLLERLGPSLGFWRAAEIAALREQPLLAPVLDLGCGDGFVTSLVLPRVDIGLDPDRQALAGAARRGIYTRLVPDPAEHSTLPSESISTILSNSVLEHLSEIDAALAAAARLLRPGGRLVLTTPTPAFSRSLVLPSPRYSAWRNRALAHLNLWSPEEWSAHLRRAGLRPRFARPYLRPALVRAWDALELLQMVWVGRYRLAGQLWKRLPGSLLTGLARSAARLDLSARADGGGQLIVAVKE